MSPRLVAIAFSLTLLAACTEPAWQPASVSTDTASVAVDTTPAGPLPPAAPPVSAAPLPVDSGGASIRTGNTKPGELVAFARTLVGVPYRYAGTDPATGFDCSGFVTHVFNHFGIAVPRSSVDFTNVGQTVSQATARPGDLVLFTGTDSAETAVGHMGIVVTAPPDSLRFIHATSGKAYGVTVTAMNDYYQKRFVRMTRVFR